MDMAVTQQHQPPETQINGFGQPSISSTKPPPPPSILPPEKNPVPKRRRRPSVRLGEIGDQPAAALTKLGRNPNRIRPGSHSGHINQSVERENADSVAIGSWKTKVFSKPKRPRTNWVLKVDEEGDGFVRDSETEQTPVNSVENERDFNFRVSVGDDDHDDDGVELDGPCENNGGGQSVRRGDDGVRVWLNGLGLGRYWPVFQIHEVDEEVLPLLTLEDLKDMGINAVGSRRKMFSAIQKLSEVFS